MHTLGTSSTLTPVQALEVLTWSVDNDRLPGELWQYLKISELLPLWDFQLTLNETSAISSARLIKVSSVYLHAGHGVTVHAMRAKQKYSSPICFL